jgi:hypothetical protein
MRLSNVHQGFQPGLEMHKSRDVLETPIGELGSALTLGWGDPAKGPAQAVVVVVAVETGQSGFGLRLGGWLGLAATVAAAVPDLSGNFI